jgi:predicted dehydrogenase
MPQQPVRYAVVGLGNIAQVAVLPAFAHAKENSKLVALLSSDTTKLRELAKKYGVEHTGGYDRLEAVLAASQADAVYIALPNNMHRTMTERAAAAGKHVLCEKPMATSSIDCEAMIAATRAAHVKLMIAYRLHFEEANLTAIDRVRRGEIGDLRIFSSVFSQQVRDEDIRTKAETGGGALSDMGIYCINAARYIFGEEPIEVRGFAVAGTDERFHGVDMTTAAILGFQGGRVAQITCSQGAADVSEFRVVGTKGDIRLEPAYGYAGELAEHVTLGGKTHDTSYARRDQFAPELIHFSDCILGDTDPEPDGEEGLCDVRIIEAIEQSARTGQRVRLAPFLRKDRPNLRLEMKRPPVAKVEPVNAPSPSK